MKRFSSNSVFPQKNQSRLECTHINLNSLASPCFRKLWTHCYSKKRITYNYLLSFFFISFQKKTDEKIHEKFINERSKNAKLFCRLRCRSTCENVPKRFLRGKIKDLNACDMKIYVETFFNLNFFATVIAHRRIWILKNVFMRS